MRQQLATRFGWYASRLAAMTPAEIAHRVREQAKRAAFRGDRSGWLRFDVGHGPLIAPVPLVSTFRQEWPASLWRRCRELVAEMRSGQLRLLGCQWPSESMRALDPKLWFLDPISGQHWPGTEAYCFDVRYRHTDGFGDVKFVWEINRLQFLHVAAAVAAREEDHELGEWTFDVISAWMDANPPYRGINWTSGIELALRLVTVAIVIAGAPNTLDLTLRHKLRSFVAAHAYWLARYPSRYSSANNHRVAEGLGLLIAGMLIPDLPEASQWRNDGLAILDWSCTSQFHDDGVGAEQSPTYAAFTLEMISFALVLRGVNGSLSHRERLIAATQFLRTLLDEAGSAPRIGDDDEGRVVAMPNCEPRYVASIVAANASILAAPELAPPERDEHIRDLIYGVGPAKCRATDRSAAPNICHYPAGGYTIVRQDIEARRMMLVFDHGPLGFLSIAAHGHADALALWLHIDRQPVLIDAGTYLYHAGLRWRDYFRSTAAHNTLELADQSQSLAAGAFNWRHKASARIVEFHDGDNWKIVARHDGYKRRFGVEHQRTLHCIDRGFEIGDQLLGRRGKWPATVSFLIHPNLTARMDRDSVLISASASDLIHISGPSGFATELCCGEDSIAHSIQSPAFGIKSPATRIVFRKVIETGEHCRSKIRFVDKQSQGSTARG
jgi:hypothetical protein